MAVNSVLQPFPVFVDTAGLPLENGYIYIGAAGFEARTTPKASFFDVTQTIPTGTASGAAVRTRSGVPVNNSNAPAMIYVDGDYSISVCDRNGVLLYSSLNTTLALNVGGMIGPIFGPDGNLGAVGIGFTNEPNTGFVRSGAGSIQTVASGVLVSTSTATGTTFAQPTVLTGAVSGAGFTAAVAAISQPVDADLTALAALSTTGMIARTGAGTAATRTITAGTGITVTNGDGVAGNPTIAMGVNEAGWLPYDGATGLFYDFAVNGSVASVETPAFSAGYEYMIIYELVGTSGATGENITLALYRTAAAAYATGLTIWTSNIYTQTMTGFSVINMAQRSMRAHFVDAFSAIDAVNGTAAAIRTSGAITHTTATAIGKARIVRSGGNITAGKMYLYRRTMG